MNDCESCMLHYCDPDDGMVCIGNFDEFQKRDSLIRQLWDDKFNESNPNMDVIPRKIPSAEDNSRFVILAYQKCPCKYYTTYDEFIAWKEQQH